MTREDAIRRILSLVAHQRNGDWWGDDTACGTDAELVAEGLAILARLDAAQPKQCYWSVDLETFKCPLHGGGIGLCPLPSSVVAAAPPPLLPQGEAPLGKEKLPEAGEPRRCDWL